MTVDGSLLATNVLDQNLGCLAVLLAGRLRLAELEPLLPRLKLNGRLEEIFNEERVNLASRYESREKYILIKNHFVNKVRGSNCQIVLVSSVLCFHRFLIECEVVRVIDVPLHVVAHSRVQTVEVLLGDDVVAVQVQHVVEEMHKLWNELSTADSVMEGNQTVNSFYIRTMSNIFLRL